MYLNSIRFNKKAAKIWSKLCGSFLPEENYILALTGTYHDKRNIGYLDGTFWQPSVDDPSYQTWDVQNFTMMA